MIFNQKSRRQFLTGAGKLGLLLPLPVLPSLMPRSAWAAPVAAPLRMVQCLSAWGQFTKSFHPTFPSLEVLDPATNIKGAKLTSLPGSISTVIGSGFDTLKGKMNVPKNLHVKAYSGNHNASLSSCAAGSGDPGRGACPVPNSIEWVLSTSRKIYPAGSAGTVKFMGVHLKEPKYAGGAMDFSFNGNVNATMGVLTDLKAVYSKFATSFQSASAASSGMPVMDPAQADRVKLVQEVYQDYKGIESSGKLSTADRPRLEAYMALVAEVEASLAAPVKSCADPKPTSFADSVYSDTQHHDLAKVLAAALACNLTRVVDYLIDGDDGSIHTYQHNLQIDKHAAVTSVHGRRFAYFWTLLDSLKDADGSSVLDNSLTWWGNNAGMSDSGGGAHVVHNLPLVTAGSGGGRLKTGYFIDFGGRPYNNWLVTICTAMGLEPADYEKGGRVGLGEYDPKGYVKYPDEWVTDSAKRSPLPFIWKGG